MDASFHSAQSLTLTPEIGAKDRLRRSKPAMRLLQRNVPTRLPKQNVLSTNSTMIMQLERRGTSGRTSSCLSPVCPARLIMFAFRDQEEEYLATLSASLSTGTTWERISDLVELQNSQSKTLARTGTGTTDLTRFKEVLLRLKREGDSAPGAAGY